MGTVEAAGVAVKASAKDSLLLFFAVSYALMWTCFFAVATGIPANTIWGRALLLLGAFAPSIAAVGLAWRAGKQAAVNTLLQAARPRHVSLRWYIFALTYTVVVKLAVAVIHRFILGAWPAFGDLAWYLIPFGIALSTPFQIGEELGWRGYALPRLAARFGLAPASILLGLVWGIWHLPQFFIREGDSYQQSFPLFVLEVTAVSVLMAWLWERTGGSVLLTMILHAAINNSKDIVPSAVPGGTQTFGFRGSAVGYITLLVLWICAGYFLFQMRRHGTGPSAMKVQEV